ncbi:MAG: hypothetical protein ACD_22C00218G0002 [uncultured bacterium]|nr:MAG: hypothetical protein ACD_22C00218G0002 [uncultured bacterium]
MFSKTQMLKKFQASKKTSQGIKRNTGSKSTTRFSKSSTNQTVLLMLTYLSTFALFGIIAGTFLLIILFAVFSRDLPNPNTLLQRSSQLSTKIMDRNGKLIYEVYGDKNRELITIDKVSTNVIHATLATEDSAFYQHKGFSLRGILRAVKNMVFGGGSLQSGSTLTQQVVKNAVLSQEQTITRKVKELILSLQLENKYTKNEILQMYLNETPYGGQNYGIMTAAKTYFNKAPSELSIAESAYLAGLPQRPSYYSHFGSNPEAGIERKNYVLYLMNVRGWIGEDGKKYYINDVEYEAAKNEELKFESFSTPFKAPHFVFYVKGLLADKFGEEAVEQGGLQVKTTLDLDLQDTAQQIVLEEVDEAGYLNVGNGSLVALDSKTGQILAMVGSKGYFLDQLPEGCISGTTGPNSCTFEPYLNVTLASRQPGSSIKPITYANLLMQGYTASFPLLDVPTTFYGGTYDKPYTPENYDGQFRGPMSLRKSLGNSLNIPAVKALKIGGIDSMIDLAEKMGISTLKDRSRYGLALTLGGGETKLLEMTGAYATFAGKGVYKEPSAILEVKDGKGTVLYNWRDNGGTRALSEEVAFLIADILSDDGARSEAFGFGSLLNIPGYQVAAKTGTTDDKRDNYAMGFTPSVTVGVWVGNNNNDKMNPTIASGITGATPIWNRFMKAYLKDKTAEKFETPKNVKKIEVDQLTGMLPFKDFPKRNEWFAENTEPTAQSTWFKTIEVCEKDGKIANDSCKDAGKTEVNTYVKITAELSEWQNDVDKWVYEHYKSDEKYFPPTTISHLEYDDGDVSNDNSVYVDFMNLKDGDKVGVSFRLGVEVSSASDVEEVRIYDNDSQVTKDSSEPFGYNFTYSATESAEHIYKVVAQDEEGNKGEATIKLKVGM